MSQTQVRGGDTTGVSFEVAVPGQSLTVDINEAGIRSYVDMFMEDVVRRMEPPKQNASHSEAKQTSAAADGSGILV